MQDNYGLVAEFSSADALLEAAKKTKQEGYKNVDAYSPFPIHGLGDVLGFSGHKVAMLMLLGGIIGGLSGLGLEFWTSAIDYPLNIGGRPLASFPSFMPITFECTVLASALTGVVSMFVLNGLPEPYHPLFNVKKFERVTTDGFFLCVESTDPKFDASKTKKFLEGLNAEGVYDVEN
jgi:hypothetical protein